MNTLRKWLLSLMFIPYEALLYTGNEVSCPSIQHDPFFSAVEQGDIVNVQKILRQQKNAILGRDWFGSTALMRASARGQYALVCLLLEAGACVNIRNTHGDTALLWAVQYNHTMIAEHLIKAHAAIAIANRAGDTPLIWACHHGNKALVRLLLQHKAPINMVNKAGDTALMNAVLNTHASLISLLITHGADINKQNNNGDTALLLATRTHKYAMVKRLLACQKIDTSLKDQDGKTALQWAYEQKQLVIAELIQCHDNNQEEEIMVKPAVSEYAVTIMHEKACIL